MILSHIILAILWIIYCLLHSVLASITVKNKLKQILGTTYKHYRLFYTLFSFFFLVAVLYYQVTITTTLLFSFYPPVFISGIIIGSAGLFLMMICIKKYFMNLSGLKSLVNEGSYSQLEIKGVHRYVRHPLYLGTFAFIWGLLLVFPYLSLLIANAIITMYTLVGIKLEEKKLVDEFGEQYSQYCKQVPKLLPGFKPKQ